MSKLEKRIKEKLGQRELTPSAGAWERIAEELGEEKKSTSKTNIWFIAAAISALLLTLSVMFFTKNEMESVEQTPVVVNQDSSLENINETPQLVNVDTPISNQEAASLPTIAETEHLMKQNSVVFEEEQRIKKDVEIDETESFSKTPYATDEEVASTMLIEDKLQEVLALVTAMENDSITVTDQEIDSLLLQAQRELLTDKLLNSNIEVDALTLLNEVELELFEDDRDQLFNTLKDSFFKLRTAVADRNQ